MLIRIILAMVLLTACQGGRIPCPTFKAAKSTKTHHKSYVSLMAKAESEKGGNKQARSARVPHSKYVDDVSVEEWDCPQPGGKKYLPRHIKANIRNNMKRMNDDPKFAGTDSTAVR